MKFNEIEQSLELVSGAVIKLQMTNHQGTLIYWGFIAEDEEEVDNLVLLNTCEVEEIENIYTDKIHTTQGSYLILAVYSNPVVQLE